MFGWSVVRFILRADESTICSVPAQLGNSEETAVEAAAKPVILRNSLLVCLSIKLSLFIEYYV
jgi:hypothetical protein